MKRIASCRMSTGILAVYVLVAGNVFGNDDLVRTTVVPFVKQHCGDCHSEHAPEAGVRLTNASAHVDLLAERRLWARALDQVKSGMMPPDGDLVPSADREHFVSSLDRLLNAVDWKAFSRPGRLGMARLTAVEYRNSIRDIFGVDLDAGIYLPRDPEGRTGFTNDRAGLSFSRNAFETYLKEAERAVDAVMGYGHEDWQQSIETEDVWRESSDKSVLLTESEDGVVIKDANAPFRFTVDPPHAGMYEIDFEVNPIDHEPLSGMAVFLYGRLIKEFSIRGDETSTYSMVANLPATSSTITLGFAKELAPIIQPKFEPRLVPIELERKIRKRKHEAFVPDKRYPNTKDAVAALRKMNQVIHEMARVRDLCAMLIDLDRVDYERHSLDAKQQGRGERVMKEFSPGKVPLNLSAGKVAQLLGVPQRQLEKSIKRSTGFSFDVFASTVRKYNLMLKEKYPHRARKIPGKLAVDRVVIRSHRDSIPSWIFDASPTKTGAENVLARLGQRAFGRPLDRDQRDTLLRIYQAGVDTQHRKDPPGSSRQAHFEGLRDAMIGLLVSPEFLLRFSRQETSAEEDAASYEFASRLSHFLWLSLPDRRLVELAEQDGLDDRDVIDQQMLRMMDDERFTDTCSVFVEQWLDVESLEGSGAISPLVVRAMKQEPALLFRDILRDDRSLLDLIRARTTYLNDLTADHYGIEGVEGPQMRKVSLDSPQRGGLLTMGAVLVSTSTPQRTSPVTRGAWIVETLLDEELPLPPPSVPELKTNVKTRTVREELELHRQSEQCASCHDRIDPFGFVLENFDRFGVWRDRESGGEVDSSTTLSDGTNLNGVKDLRDYLVTQRRDDFVRSVTIRVFEFALGRELQYHDEQLIRDTLSQLRENGYRAHTLLRCVVNSDAFRQRQQHQD